MADEEFPREDELESRQTPALYPVGRALRETFDAENHDSLGNDLTGLMLELARVDPEAEPLPRGAIPLPPAPVAPPLPESVAPPSPSPSWWRTAVSRLMGG